MTAIGPLLATLLFLVPGLAGTLVAVATAAPSATVVLLLAVTSGWLAYRADRPAGYRGAFAGTWR